MCCKLTILIQRKPFEILPAPVVDSPSWLMSGLLVYQGMRARLRNDRGMMDRGKGIWLETVYLCDSWSAIINHAYWSVPYASEQGLNPMTNRKSSGWTKTESDGRDTFVAERIIKTETVLFSNSENFRYGRNGINANVAWKTQFIFFVFLPGFTVLNQNVFVSESVICETRGQSGHNGQRRGPEMHCCAWWAVSLRKWKWNNGAHLVDCLIS